MKDDSKIWPIIVIIFFLIVLFILIAFEVIKESKNRKENDNCNNIVETEKELNQSLTCSYTDNILNNDITIGTETIRYNFILKNKDFIAYKKEILLTFYNEDEFQNYCISCDNIEANDIKSITKGIKINITNAKNKYIYENVDIDVLKYDGEHKKTKYGLDGLNNESDIDDILFFTKDMICYWEE